ncbi:MAG: hypothetical protein LW629_10980 [Burkholderiales bacterium]|nr:hypothetical protein [Burkholderiales bacterium]
MRQASDKNRWWIALVGLALLLPLCSLIGMAFQVEIGPEGTLPHLLITVIPDITLVLRPYSNPFAGYLR